MVVTFSNEEVCKQIYNLINDKLEFIKFTTLVAFATVPGYFSRKKKEEKARRGTR